MLRTRLLLGCLLGGGSEQPHAGHMPASRQFWGCLEYPHAGDMFALRHFWGCSEQRHGMDTAALGVPFGGPQGSPKPGTHLIQGILVGLWELAPHRASCSQPRQIPNLHGAAEPPPQPFPRTCTPKRQHGAGGHCCGVGGWQGTIEPQGSPQKNPGAGEGTAGSSSNRGAGHGDEPPTAGTCLSQLLSINRQCQRRRCAGYAGAQRGWPPGTVAPRHRGLPRLGGKATQRERRLLLVLLCFAFFSLPFLSHFVFVFSSFICRSLTSSVLTRGERRPTVTPTRGERPPMVTPTRGRAAEPHRPSLPGSPHGTAPLPGHGERLPKPYRACRSSCPLGPPCRRALTPRPPARSRCTAAPTPRPSPNAPPWACRRPPPVKHTRKPPSGAQTRL